MWQRGQIGRDGITGNELHRQNHNISLSGWKENCPILLRAGPQSNGTKGQGPAEKEASIYRQELETDFAPLVPPTLSDLKNITIAGPLVLKAMCEMPILLSLE